jgi:hypothetical protein
LSVLFIWEERNSGGYEHARAGRERARAPRAPKKIHQPSNDINLKNLFLSGPYQTNRNVCMGIF